MIMNFSIESYDLISHFINTGNRTDIHIYIYKEISMGFGIRFFRKKDFNVTIVKSKPLQRNATSQ